MDNTFKCPFNHLQYSSVDFCHKTVTVIAMNHLLSPHEAARWLKVSPATLRQWRRRATGPAHRTLAPHINLYPLGPLIIFGINRLLANALKGNHP